MDTVCQGLGFAFVYIDDILVASSRIVVNLQLCHSYSSS